MFDLITILSYSDTLTSIYLTPYIPPILSVNICYKSLSSSWRTAFLLYLYNEDSDDNNNTEDYGYDDDDTKLR